MKGDWLIDINEMDFK